MIYLLVFLLSAFFVNLDQEQNKRRVYFFSFLAVILPVLLAGFRDYGIGSDTITYVNDCYDAICKVKSIDQFLVEYGIGYYGALEPGYLFLNYLVSFVGSDYHFIYFATNLIVVVAIYRSICENRQSKSMVLPWLLVMFLFYNLSLNMVRQSITVALCLISVVLYENKRYKLMVLTLFVSILSHGTGVLSVIVVFIIHSIPKIQEKVGHGKLFLWCVLSVLCFLSFYKIVFNYILAQNILNDHYAPYISHAENNQGALQTCYVIFYAYIMYVYYYAYRHAVFKDAKNVIFKYGVIHLIAASVCVMSVIVYDAYRLSFYFLLPSLTLYLPRVLNFMKYNGLFLYKTLRFGCVCLAFLVWLWDIYINNRNDTLPYTSKLLGF